MKLALGTVQFGIDYGITNRDGQASTDEVRKILNFSKENGIDTLDTASGYGDSERVLGEIGVNDYQVITKTESLELGVNGVIQSFKQSLNNLKIDSVNGLLIRAKDVQEKEADSLYEALERLKKEGLINKIGFSAYTPEQVDFLIANFDFDLIQVPFNVFDSRLIQGRQLQALKNKNVEVHVRSVFLQGALLDFGNLPKYFSTWDQQFKGYQSMVKESGLSLLEYALNFVLNIKEIDKVLVGVSSERQLREIVQAVRSRDTLEAYPINDINLLNPSLWKV
jgi:aryl-alcohol dehydrogenase-like predicted oxidoreductase